MEYTREKLQQYPVSVLRGLEIREKAEEELVQEVIDEKLRNEIHYDPNMATLSPRETDIKTPEQEAEMQRKLDEARALNVVNVPIEVEIVSSEETPVEAPIEAPVKARFCEFCDSKGVRHKKECTRLTQTQNV